MAALAGWHAAHERCRRAARRAAIPTHARLETYSVLTRLPPPHRLAPDVAAELLAGWFPAERTLVPSAKVSHRIVEQCRDRGLAGGGVYDALVGLTAAESASTLVTRDARAARTYDLLGVEVRLVR